MKTKTVKLEHLIRAIPHRPKGYEQDVRAHAIQTTDNGDLVLPEADWLALRRKYRAARQSQTRANGAPKGLVRGAARGAASMVKTGLLRQDRLDEEQFQARLDVCRQCPGGHAVWKRGDVHTCGPMLKSMRQKKRKTCGCILKRKARDRKEDCPFGYWPKPAGPDPDHTDDGPSDVSEADA